MGSMPTMQLQGKHVFITGGSEGLGLELGIQAVREGAKVSLIARTRSKLDAAKAAAEAACSSGGSVAVCCADVTNRKQVGGVNLLHGAR